jgi:hypothetical protein
MSDYGSVHRLGVIQTERVKSADKPTLPPGNMVLFYSTIHFFVTASLLEIAQADQKLTRIQ